MRLFDLVPSGLPMAAMKSISVPGASITGLGVSPEITAVLAFAGVAALAIYVFLR